MRKVLFQFLLGSALLYSSMSIDDKRLVSNFISKVKGNRVYYETLVLDAGVVSRILNGVFSNDYRGWSRVGMRGLMFENGLLWLNADLTVLRNYIPDHRRSELVRETLNAKSNLHFLATDFFLPIYEMDTESYSVRVDHKKGNFDKWSSDYSGYTLSTSGYQVCIWPRGKQKEMPPLEICVGNDFRRDGSVGYNPRYICSNDRISVIVGEQTILDEGSNSYRYLNIRRSDGHNFFEKATRFKDFWGKNVF